MADMVVRVMMVVGCAWFLFICLSSLKRRRMSWMISGWVRERGEEERRIGFFGCIFLSVMTLLSVSGISAALFIPDMVVKLGMLLGSVWLLFMCLSSLKRRRMSWMISGWIWERGKPEKEVGFLGYIYLYWMILLSVFGISLALFVL